ncbi:MAG TPA: hypothetical protein VLX44_15020 [Xanthobacteraceae bacterium]|nr:hypothetical protein [Xanthobacteraceae bacterium]
MLRKSSAPIRFHYGNHHGATALAVPAGLRSAPAGARFLATLRDLAFIAMAWAIFIGTMIYPATQIVGIAACAIALFIGAGRARGNAARC